MVVSLDGRPTHFMNQTQVSKLLKGTSSTTMRSFFKNISKKLEFWKNNFFVEKNCNYEKTFEFLFVNVNAAGRAKKELELGLEYCLPYPGELFPSQLEKTCKEMF